EEIDDGKGQQYFPTEAHQLVVAIPRESPPHPDVKEQERRNLDQEPNPSERFGQQRSVPAAEEQVGCDGGYGHHIDVLREKEHREAHAAVLRVIAGHELLLGLGKVKRRAVGLCHACRQVDQKPEWLNEHKPSWEHPKPGPRLPIDEVSKGEGIADEKD